MGNLLSAISRSHLLGFWDDFGDDLLDGFSNVVGSLLWGFCDIFFWILDLFETLYRKFAGVDTNVTSSTGEKIDGDLVLYFIQSDIVQQIFMSILVLSLFLLIIFTIFAIVKNQYAEKQEPVSKIVNGSVKALLMYLLVPIATIVCLLVGNVVLQAIDGATKTNDYSQTISDNLFSTAVYNANRFRSGTQAEKAKQLWLMIQDDMLPEHIIEEIEAECNIDLSSTSKDAIISAGSLDTVDYDTMAIIIDEAFITGNLTTSHGYSDASKWNWTTVNNFYYALKISYIIVWVGGAFLIWAIGKITWGLVARLFKMTLYYAISPAVMATFPIDNGKALGSWRGEMVKNGTMALCSVGILNVLYSILPAFNNFDLFGDTTTGGGLASSIARLFIYIIAFSSAKDLIGAISGWFGTGDALGEGVKAKGMVQSKIGTKKLTEVSKKGLGYFAGIQGGIDTAKKNGGNKFMGALQGAFSQTGAAKTHSEYVKAYNDSKKAGSAQYKAHRTSNWAGIEDDDKVKAWEAGEAKEKAKSKYSALTGEVDPSGYYDVSKDDGDNPDMLKARQWLLQQGNAGQAVFEKQLNQLKIDEERNKKQGEFVEILNNLAKAKKKELSTLDDLHGLGVDTSGWNMKDMASIKKSLNEEIQRRSAAGENTDMLKDVASQYIEASGEAASALKGVESRKKTDDKFSEYVGGVGEAIYNQATSEIKDELDEVEKAVEENKATAQQLQKRAEQYEKLMAKINEEEMFGKIGEADPKRKIIDDYNKAHPKD